MPIFLFTHLPLALEITISLPIIALSAVLPNKRRILGLINSNFLTPLNKLWFKFGKLLGFIVAPIVMGVIFFLIITPTGFIMKMLGKDLLNKKYNNKIKSYWINREKSKSTMKQQF